MNVAFIPIAQISKALKPYTRNPSRCLTPPFGATAGQGEHQRGDHPDGEGLRLVPHGGGPGAELLLLGLHGQPDPGRLRELALRGAHHPAPGRGPLVRGHRSGAHPGGHHPR